MRSLILLALCAVAPAVLAEPGPEGPCGEAVTLRTHGGTTMRYSYAPAAATQGEPATLVLLIGGGGYMDIDDSGCPRLLGRNVLVRIRPLLRQAGIATALVDSPSDLHSDEGLGGFRIAADHAADLAKVIADARVRSKGPVWVAGHSRGSISAANAAARLSGPNAPDGVILLSAMLSGDTRARRPWAAQTVTSTKLSSIKIPLLIIGHAADNCARSPANLMSDAAAKTHSTRQQAATVTGGPVAPGRRPGLAGCEVREPHDFVEQETEVAAGIVRFMRGESF